MKYVAVIFSCLLSTSFAEARSFTRSDTSQPFCKDIVANLKEVGVSVSERSMTECSLQVLGGAHATFSRPTGDPLEVTVRSNPYRMFVTRGDSDMGTCYVLHPRKVTRKVTDRDC
jgi:hypothetical protein